MIPEVRAARPEDAEATLQTLCAAFDLDADAARPIFYGDPYYDLSHKRILSLPEIGIVSCLTVVPSMIRVGGVPVSAGGIAGVATRPEYQRQGLAASLIKATVPALWDDLHYPLSLLHPLSAPFYRRFGWETASRVLSWFATPSSLPYAAGAGFVRPALLSDWPAIYDLHADLTLAETGACVRDRRRWSLIQMPVPSREIFVYEDAAGLAGYGVWERSEMLRLREMNGRTLEARRGLVGFLARQPEPTVEWAASPALLERFGLPVPETPLQPDAMLRVVNLSAALSAVHGALYAPVLRDAGATLTLLGADDLRPANTRPLRLTLEGLAVGSPQDSAWLRADIRILGQLFFGYCTPSKAAASGLLFCDSPATLALADRLFPTRSPYIAPLDQV